MSSNSTDKRNGSIIVSTTLSRLMATDDDIVLFGEDVAALGGVFGATRGLARQFGPERVFDTPISESAFVGMALGAAQAGLRPIVEIMFVDFVGVAFDQILNAISKNRYMSGGEISVPLVIRTAGGSIGSAAQHSQVLSGLLAHLPGLKVYLPGTPGDLQRLLIHAVTSTDPVVFIEHKKLLKTRVSDLPFNDAIPAGETPEPLGDIRPRTLRKGRDLVIVASGWMVQEAMIAAHLLDQNGIHAAVIDLRTIVPLDREALIDQVRDYKTVLVVDEDFSRFGVAAEVIACIAEGDTKARVFSRHALDVPQPASLVLEQEVVPSARSIVTAARELIGRGLDR